MTNTIRLAELAEYLGACLKEGNPDALVQGIATLGRATQNEISFFTNRLYRQALLKTQAVAVILSEENQAQCPVAKLVMNNPYLGYARAATLFNPALPPQPGIHPTAWISSDADIDPTAWIGAHVTVESYAVLGPGVVVHPGCVIGNGVQIGDNSTIGANVTLCTGTRLGQRVRIHPGAVLGSDGFGLAKDQDRWIKIPQLGGVLVGDDVEIGANTTIDKGALEDTLIGNGVKLDNQIQIAHNVQIGENTAIAGCVGIAGSTRIGKRCMIAGGVGIVGHIEIVDDVFVTGGSIVLQSILKPGLYSSGTPLQPNAAWHRNYHRFKQLEELAKRLHQLEQSLK